MSIGRRKFERRQADRRYFNYTIVFPERRKKQRRLLDRRGLYRRSYQEILNH